MLLTRRSFLTGLLAAPIVITTPGLLMPVKELIFPARPAEFGLLSPDDEVIGPLADTFENGRFVNGWMQSRSSFVEYRDGKHIWAARSLAVDAHPAASGLTREMYDERKQ